MKTTTRSISLMLILLLVSALTTVAATIEVEGDVDIRLSSGFAWRGQFLNDEMCFQPAALIRNEEFSLGIWGNWDLTDVENSEAHKRVDITGDYSYMDNEQLVRIGATAYVYYDSQVDNVEDTLEIFLTYAQDITALPALTVYYDFEQADGFYVTFSISHTFDVASEKVSLDLGASISAADDKYSEFILRSWANMTDDAADDGDDGEDEEPEVTGESGLVDLTLTASLPVVVNDRVVVTPALRYITLLNDNLRDAAAAAGREESQIIFSVGLNVLF